MKQSVADLPGWQTWLGALEKQTETLTEQIRCLADLAQTSDLDLRYFNRNTWALIIVLSFPIGPMLYLLYAKNPRRYR